MTKYRFGLDVVSVDDVTTHQPGRGFHQVTFTIWRGANATVYRNWIESGLLYSLTPEELSKHLLDSVNGSIDPGHSSPSGTLVRVRSFTVKQGREEPPEE